MTLPLFKHLEIFDHRKPAIWAKLVNANPGSQPLALDLRSLGLKEIEALEAIEEFFGSGKGRNFPYPVYVITTLLDFDSTLEKVSSPERLPSYYKVKNRPLNIKENNFLSKVALKQKKLENINPEEFKPVAAKYASNHKIIYKKQMYLDYLTEVLEELKKS